MLATQWTFLDVIWSMLLFSLFVIWVFIVIVAFVDNFRRKDHSGWMKALWTIFIVVLPFIGVLTYMIVRPRAADDF
jgi:hypothetical protein